MKWLRAHWVPIVAAVVGLGLGGATASAGVKTKTTTDTVTTETTVTHTSTVTKTIVRHAKPRVIVRTTTVTAPAKTVTVTTPPTQSTTPVSSSSGGGGRYTGDGEKNVGTITVSQDSTLRWTCSGDCSVFGITSDPNGDFNDISVDSANSATSGDTSVSAGTYKNVNVISSGSWSFTISPG